MTKKYLAPVKNAIKEDWWQYRGSWNSQLYWLFSEDMQWCYNGVWLVLLFEKYSNVFFTTV